MSLSDSPVGAGTPRPGAVPVMSPPDALAWSEWLLDGMGGADAASGSPRLALWAPRGVYAAVGISQNPDRELDVQAMRRDGVGLVRRQSGGGAVLLYPGGVCWEAWAREEDIAREGGEAGIRSSYAFLARPVLDALRKLGVEAFQAGISDISAKILGESRKIAGTAQLRRRGAVLVHGVLLLTADVGALSAYLRMPSAEPDYRMGRGHREFCVSVAEILGGDKRGDALEERFAAAVSASALERGWKMAAAPATLAPGADRLAAVKYRSSGWNWEKIRTGM